MVLFLKVHLLEIEFRSSYYLPNNKINFYWSLMPLALRWRYGIYFLGKILGNFVLLENSRWASHTCRKPACMNPQNHVTHPFNHPPLEPAPSPITLLTHHGTQQLSNSPVAFRVIRNVGVGKSKLSALCRRRHFGKKWWFPWSCVMFKQFSCGCDAAATTTTHITQKTKPFPNSKLHPAPNMGI